MKFDFKLDEKALLKMMEPAMQEVAKDYNQEFETLTKMYKGKPLEEIKPALSKVFKRHGGSITENELNEYAQMVSDGVKIRFEA